jgi:hypothetical protein
MKDETINLLYQPNIQEDNDKPSIFQSVSVTWPEYESKSITVILLLISLSNYS